MRELSLHIIDILENSRTAGATRIDLAIRLDSAADRLTIRVTDNGRGMDAEMVRRATDPFVTTRTARKVGLGLPLLAAAASRCHGDLSIVSEPGKGTSVTALFQHSHIDRAPLGNIIDTVTVFISGNPEIAFILRYSVDGREMRLDTAELQAELSDVSLSHPLVAGWIKQYLRKKLIELRGGEDW
ncbi:MAG: ATP-binding protein [bacterium]|jgi:hypothetical protein